MKTCLIAAAASIVLAAPVQAATAPAPQLDDFACLVRTMFMAGASEAEASKSSDTAVRDRAAADSAEAYEAASYFVGRLTLSKGVVISKARFDSEVMGLTQLQQDGLAAQIQQCTGRAKSERAAFIAPLAGK